MNVVFTTMLLISCVVLRAQKPSLDTAALAVWPTIDHVAINADGTYISYTIRTPRTPDIMYLQSADGNFRRELGYAEESDFTRDGKRFICHLPGDSLCIVDLVNRSVRYQSSVLSYKVPDQGDGRWMAYLPAGGELVIVDLISGVERHFDHVQDFQFSAGGKVLVLQGVDTLQGNIPCSWLKKIDLAKGGVLTLCRGYRTSYISFDASEEKLAFMASKWEKEDEPVVRLYRPGLDSGAVVVEEQTPGIEPGFEVKEDRLEFSPDGGKLFFTLHHSLPTPRPTRLGASVNVWNYKDDYPQYAQSNDLIVDHLVDFKTVLRINSGEIIRLQQETDGGAGIQQLNMGGDANFFLNATRYYIPENYWRPGDRPSLWLVNTNDGARKQIASKARFDFAMFSPGGKYVVWFNKDMLSYFTYNLRTGVCRNISAAIPASLTNELSDVPCPPWIYGILTWLHQDSALLLYDRYDVWSVDPEGKKAPVNLTNGFGRRHRIVLRGVYVTGRDWQKSAAITDSGDMMLCALDDSTKDNGFYAINIHRPGNPVKLIMSPTVYYYSGISYVEFPQTIFKASQADRYLLTRSSATEYPNVVMTGDFKVFEPMTNLQPQRKYNWLTTEAIRWKTFAGQAAQGILYKPEDFDPRKKYPLIFYYYEKKSDGLNVFHPAELANGSLNIPWFVSQGYLVFSPDIAYTPGDVGAGVYDYVVSAARMMRAKPWVDADRVGLQAHSFGGFETNYLVTRTDLFAAAVSAMGMSNLISLVEVNDVHPDGFEDYVEYGQMRMPFPYWQRPELYIRNSPVFHVDKVVTPLLLIANKNDYAVPWQQGEELFMALRRLNKRVWLLQYDPGGHYVNGDNALDYTLRMTQFFDHYLKGKSEPRWMRASIPARLKGAEDGLGF